MVSSSFGRLLTYFRGRRELSQEALASAAGVNRKTIIRYERGQSVPQRWGIMQDLLQVLMLSDADAQLLIEARANFIAERRGETGSPINPSVLPPVPPLLLDPSMEVTAPALPEHSGITSPLPQQLRAPVTDFTGRVQYIQDLKVALKRLEGEGPIAVISGVRGMPGVGKTELAMVVAHSLMPTFPDAQLVVAMRGTSSTPLTAAQALRGIVRAFNPIAPPTDDLDALQAQYRSALANKRVLIIADDAKDASQVRPLLPPMGSALLITSRNRFLLPGMHVVDLDVLSVGEAVTFILTVCNRVQGYASDLARLCGYLPLALRISASVLEINDDRDILDYLNDLKVERLHHLRDPQNPDDPEASIEASVQLSYVTLDSATQDVFCQLSVFPASFTRSAALAIVDANTNVITALEYLRRCSLVEWDSNARRYNLHELVRVFASNRLADSSEVHWRHAQYYANVTREAGLLFDQGDPSIIGGLALFDTERTHIDAGWRWVIQQPPSERGDILIRQYTFSTIYIGMIRYLPDDRLTLLEASLAAARRQHDRLMEGRALGNIGNVYAELGEQERAIPFYHQWLEISREVGDRRAETGVLANLGHAYTALRAWSHAIHLYEQGISQSVALGEQKIEGYIRGGLGRIHESQGDFRGAAQCYEHALNLARSSGDVRGEIVALEALARNALLYGNLQQAKRYSQQALTISQSISDRRSEADVLVQIGTILQANNEYREAISYLDRALVLAEELSLPHVIIRALINLSLVHAHENNRTVALTYCERAENLLNTSYDLELEVMILGAYGEIYGSDNIANALEYFERVLTITEDHELWWLKSQNLLKLAIIYRESGQINRSITTFRQALDVWEQHSSEVSGIVAGIYMQLGISFRTQGNHSESIEMLMKGLDVARILASEGLVALCLMQVGASYYEQGNFPLALDSLEEAKHLANEQKLYRLETIILNTLGEIYRASKDLLRALNYHEQALSLARAVGDKESESTSSWEIGLVLEQQGEWVHALEMMDMTLEYEHSRGKPYLQEFVTKVEQIRRIMEIRQRAHNTFDYALKSNSSLQQHEILDRLTIAAATFINDPPSDSPWRVLGAQLQELANILKDSLDKST